MKFLVADFGGRLHRAKDYGPASMQGARVALSKGFPGEVGCRNPKVLPREAAQIISKQSNFFQFGRSCGNRLANIRKREEFGCAGAAVFRAASGVGGSNGRAGRDLWQRKLHLVFFT